MVDDFEARTKETTETSSATTRQIEMAVGCVGGTDFREPAQCTLPTDARSEG